jgi:hypothetical protein
VTAACRVLTFVLVAWPAHRRPTCPVVFPSLVTPAPVCSFSSLDRSQYEAVRLLLTSEVAVVRGPPGTGKTYTGLKAVECLLTNRNLLRHGVGANGLPLGPQRELGARILVMCYTNHALDQFLLGVSKFTDNIVRVVGGGAADCGTRCRALAVLERVGRPGGGGDLLARGLLRATVLVVWYARSA